VPGGRGVQPESEYQFVTLDDFSAGIYDYSSIAGSVPNVPGGKAAADPNGTYSCIALPGGGLGPLPGVAKIFDWGPGANTPPALSYLVGFLVHDELTDGGIEIFSILEYDNGTNHYWSAYSYDTDSNAFHSIVDTVEPSAAGIFGSPYPQMTRVAPTNPTTTPGQPVIVFPNGGPASNTNDDTGQLYLYPNPSAPTVYGAQALIVASGGGWSSISGQVLVHESRIVVLAGTGYGWPAGGGFNTNENVNFTDPPNSSDYGDQMTVFAAEEPYGYGAGGSISAGELFLVKHRGGGLIVTGDLLTPTVTFLPGVTSTGTMYGRGSSGLPGFVYCSIDNGAWIWNGSNTSQKISQQLDDSFFVVAATQVMGSNNYGFFAECIGDKVYFSNNWVYDVRSNSWWRFYPTTAEGGQDFFWINGVNGTDYYCAPIDIVGEGAPYCWQFSESLPSQTYQWHSLPIKLTDNRLVDLREVVVRATSNLSDTTGVIKVSLYRGATLLGSVTTPSGDIQNYPSMIRMPFGGVTAAAGDIPYATDQLTIRINASATEYAPNVHSIGLGFNQRMHAETVGVSS
jgi:hypothetical protein